MDCKITLIPGDGIGPEIVAEAVKVLNAVADKYGHKFDYTKILMGGCSIDECGVPLTDEAVAIAKASDAVLLGAVGGNVGNSRWYDVAPDLRPEAGLLKIRKDLELFANIRPAYLYNELKTACPLKEEIIGDGFDMVNILLHNSAFFKYLYNIDSTKTPIFIKIEKAHSRTVFGRLHQPTSSCGRVLSSYDIFCITENPIRISHYTKKLPVPFTGTGS